MGLTLRYGPARAQRVFARIPPGPGPHPVCVLVHGGFWRSRYTHRLMDGLAADLERRGWIAWNLEYRRLGPLSRGGWPQTFDDVRAGIALLASRPDVDTTRIVAVGHSAGGHLALLAAADPPDDVILTRVVGQAAVADLREADRLDLGDGVTRRFANGDPRADPMSHLPTGVRTLLIHGEQDDTVPADISRRYAAAARAAGDDVTLEIRPGEGHYDHIDPNSTAWRTVIGWLPRP